jgi:hypothetical protein
MYKIYCLFLQKNKTLQYHFLITKQVPFYINNLITTIMNKQKTLIRMAYLFGAFLFIGSSYLHATPPDPFPDPPTPPYAKSTVSYIFSSTYGNVTISGFSTKEKATTSGGKSVVKVESNGFLRTTLSAAKDVSEYTHLHFDVYNVSISSTYTIQIKSGDNGSNTKNVSKDLNKWISTDIALSELTTASLDLTQINYFQLRAGSGSEFYADNVYFFYKATPTAVEDIKDENTCKIIFDRYNKSLLLSAEKSIESVKICSMQGRILKNIVINSTEVNIGITDLQSGVYIVTAKLADGSMITGKIVK